MHVGQSKLASLVTIGQCFMMDAALMQQVGRSGLPHVDYHHIALAQGRIFR